MYVHALKFYLSHLSLYPFGVFCIWCEVDIYFIFSPFFPPYGYLIVPLPFIEKTLSPLLSAMPLQHKPSISICLSLYLVFLFCLIGPWSICLCLHQYCSCLFNKSWDLVEQVFLPSSSSSRVSNPPLVLYTSQYILESSCQVPREKKKQPVGVFDWDYIESIDCFGENRHLYNTGSSNLENHIVYEDLT